MSVARVVTALALVLTGVRPAPGARSLESPGALPGFEVRFEHPERWWCRTTHACTQCRSTGTVPEVLRVLDGNRPVELIEVPSGGAVRFCAP
jgi:hypothetical protein